MAEMENMEQHRAWDDWRYGNRGVANAGLGLGIAGTALGLLNGGLGLMGGMNGNGWNHGYNGYNGVAMCVDRPVAKETFELQQRVSRLESEKALIESEQNTEVKIADVYERLAKQSLELERQQNRRWEEQLVWNARQDARIAVLERDVHQLYGMTGLYVEANKVTPLPMQRYNYWTTPTTPAPGTEAPTT